MKHKHYEMIVAKAANMDLVVCTKHEDAGWRAISTREFMPAYSDNEYFLCLPQHKEACLHWLNGGESETDRSFDEFVLVDEACDFNFNWWCDGWFMQEDYKSRIKPKKEKRWIGTCKNFVTALNYPSIDECKDAVGDDTSWEFHEIEVEV